MRKYIIAIVPMAILLCLGLWTSIYAFGTYRLAIATGSIPGVSLVYQVSPPKDAPAGYDFAPEMAVWLQERVDPDYLRNIRFSPKPSNQIEIQSPAASSSELKLLLQEMGPLEFNIIVEDQTSPEVRDMVIRLTSQGPNTDATGPMKWVESPDPPNGRDLPTQIWQGRPYVLVYTTSDKALTHSHGTGDWKLERAYPASDALGRKAIGIRLDDKGAAMFEQLTAANLKHMLAVVINNRLVSAARLQSKISKSAVITREAGFSEAELRRTIPSLNAGCSPAGLSMSPISEIPGSVTTYLPIGSILRGVLVLGMIGLLFTWIVMVTISLVKRFRRNAKRDDPNTLSPAKQ